MASQEKGAHCGKALIIRDKPAAKERRILLLHTSILPIKKARRMLWRAFQKASDSIGCCVLIMFFLENDTAIAALGGGQRAAANTG